MQAEWSWRRVVQFAGVPKNPDSGHGCEGTNYDRKRQAQVQKQVSVINDPLCVLIQCKEPFKVNWMCFIHRLFVDCDKDLVGDDSWIWLKRMYGIDAESRDDTGDKCNLIKKRDKNSYLRRNVSHKGERRQLSCSTPWWRVRQWGQRGQCIPARVHHSLVSALLSYQFALEG